jgi:AcrR family transcriptional regulator
MEAAPPTRRRRSDARRSIEAIVSGARALLSERVDASMDEIATAAGLTRQTVYAHFPSRDLLVAAVINAERAEGLAALEAAGLDDLPPVEALRRFLDISWEIVERCPLVLDPALAKTPGPDGGDAHDLVGPHLERIFRRGQRSGDFDRALPAKWLTAATFGLGHTAAEAIAAGHLTKRAATSMLLRSVLRLCGTEEP